MFLLILVATLLVFGLIMLFSTSYATYGNEKLKLQGAWIVVSAAACLLVRRIDYHVFCRHSLLVVGLVTGALLYLATAYLSFKAAQIRFPLTSVVKGAVRWFQFGPVRLQPSEFAKIAIILFLANYYGKNSRYIREFKRGVLIPLGLMGVVAGLVLLGGSLSVTVITVLTIIAVVFVAGVPLRWMSPVLLALAAGGLLVGTLVFTSSLPEHPEMAASTETAPDAGSTAATEQTEQEEQAPNAVAAGLYKLAGIAGEERKSRITCWLDPESKQNGNGYQLWHSILALGSGGLEGLGFTNSRMKKFYLPESHTDFIIAIVGEELGYLWVCLVIAAYALLTLIILYMAGRAADREGSLICTGIGISFGLHAFVNIAVVSGFFPTTGVTAPFISYGGSSILAAGIGLGLILSVSRHADQVMAERLAQPGQGPSAPPILPGKLFT